MRILSVERFGADELLATLRRTRLRGYDGAQLYSRAALELVPAADPDSFTPAQNYVLAPGVEKALELREALLRQGIDVFALDGGVHVTTSDDPGERIPVLPPIVEESQEPDGRTVLLVNDGMHRVFAARQLGLPISTVIIRNVPPEYPYYAFALAGSWPDVVVLDELPDGHQKKEYRQPTSYKALFREFNALFPGVQKQRRRTNPSHLTL